MRLPVSQTIQAISYLDNNIIFGPSQQRPYARKRRRIALGERLRVWDRKDGWKHLEVERVSKCNIN